MTANTPDPTITAEYVGLDRLLDYAEQIVEQSQDLTKAEALSLAGDIRDACHLSRRALASGAGGELVGPELYMAFWRRQPPDGPPLQPFDQCAPAIQRMWENIAADARALHQPPEAPDHVELVAEARAKAELLEIQLRAITGADISDIRNSDGGLELARKVVNIQGASGWAIHELRRLADALASAPLGEDAQPYKDALHDLVMLKAQDDIGCVPAPTKEQWAKAWDEAVELTRNEP